MDLSNFVSGAGVSKWVPTVANPGFIQHANRKQKEQQLLQEAASLLPDGAALTKTLLDHDIPYADLAPIQGQLQMLMNSYLEDYQKSPFSAFSRDAKEKVKMMQHLVNDPKLKQVAQENALFKKHTEKILNEDDLGNNVNVKDGKIAIWRPGKSGYSRVWIEPDQIRDGDQVMRITDEIDAINNVFGLSRLGEKYSVDMTPHKELEDKILKYFSSTGHTTFDSMGEAGTERSKSNAAQLDSAMKIITEGAGLTQADWNTLMSIYYSKNLGTKPVSKKEAQAWVMDYVKNIRDKYEIGSDTLSGKGGTGAGANLKNAVDLDPATAAASGLTEPISFKQTLSGEDGANDLFNVINGNVFADFTSFTNGRKVGDDDDKRDSRALSDNKFAQSINKMYIPNLGTGSFDQVAEPGAVKKSVVIDDTRPTAVVSLFTDASGQPADAKLQARLTEFIQNPNAFVESGIPAEFRPFIVPSQKDGQNGYGLRSEMFFTVPTIVPDRSTFGSDELVGLGQQLAGAKYTSGGIGEQGSYYEDHNDAELSGSRMFASDDFYKPVLLLKVPSVEEARRITGYPVKAPQQAGTAGIMGGDRGNTGFIPQQLAAPDIRTRRQLLNTGYLSQMSFPGK
jgi:hypothetical protein